MGVMGGYEPFARVSWPPASGENSAAKRWQWLSALGALKLNRGKGDASADGGTRSAAGQALQRRGESYWVGEVR